MTKTIKNTLMTVATIMVTVFVMTVCNTPTTIGTYDPDFAGGSLYTPRGWEKVSPINAQASIDIYIERGVYGLTLDEL